MTHLNLNYLANHMTVSTNITFHSCHFKSLMMNNLKTDTNLGGGSAVPYGMKPSSYLLSKFVYLTSQMCHTLVVHPLLGKILDVPL